MLKEWKILKVFSEKRKTFYVWKRKSFSLTEEKKEKNFRIKLNSINLI